MTQHEIDALDAKLREVEAKLTLLENIRRQVEALGKRGTAEAAFFAGRRSMAYERASSGGVGAAQLGQEILFLLPDEFVEFYGNLFHEALRVGDGNKGGDSGVQKAKGNTGTVLGSDTRLQSSGTGKRFKLTPLVIGSQAAMDVKDGMDRELKRLVGDASRTLSALRSSQGPGLERSSEDSVRPPGQCHNKACRGFLKKGWEFCPRCGTSTLTGQKPVLQGGAGGGNKSD